MLVRIGRRRILCSRCRKSKCCAKFPGCACANATPRITWVVNKLNNPKLKLEKVRVAFTSDPRNATDLDLRRTSATRSGPVHSVCKAPGESPPPSSSESRLTSRASIHKQLIPAASRRSTWSALHSSL